MASFLYSFFFAHFSGPLFHKPHPLPPVSVLYINFGGKNPSNLTLSFPVLLETFRIPKYSAFKFLEWFFCFQTGENINDGNLALAATTFTCAALALIIRISVAIFAVRTYLNFGYGLSEKGKTWCSFCLASIWIPSYFKFQDLSCLWSIARFI